MSSATPHPDPRINYLLEETGVGTWECDHVTGLLTHNGPFISGVGSAPALIESRLEDWASNVHPDDRERMVREFFAAAPRFESEYRVSRADGSWMWVTVRGRALERSDDGRIRRSAGTITDISKRKHAEELLQIQHDFAGILLMQPDQPTLFRAILDSALRLPGLDGGGLYWRQADGGYALVTHQGFSSEFIAAVGTLAPSSPQSDVIRNGQLLCSCSDNRSHCNQPDLVRAPALIAEGLRTLVVLPIMVDGEALACLNLASRRMSSTPATTVTALETLTRQFAQGLARQRAAEAATERENNLSGLFSALDDFLFVVGLDGQILHYNPAVADKLGYGQSLIGQPLIDVHPPDRRAEAARILGEMLDGSRASCPLPLLKANGDQLMVDTRAVRGS